jgi:spermidine synthase
MKWIYDKYFPGFGICLEIKKLIFSKKSKYQKIEIFQTSNFGRMLLLDGSIQLTERDEFIYSEMITHVPLLSFSGAKKVLIVGDGDGGTLREVLRHPVEEVYFVEIDKEVIKACRRYMSAVPARSFEDKRVKMVIADGAKFVKDFNDFFDVIIVGAPDPVGAGKILFSLNFYKSIYKALTPSGMMICQSGPVIFWPETIYGQINKKLKRIFPKVRICLSFIPTYPGAFWSFTVGSKKTDPARIPLKDLRKRYNRLGMKTKYYNPEIHLNSFVLPNFLR